MEKPTLSTTEFNSLYDFYNATNGPLWIWHNVSVQSKPWNFSIPDVNPCFDHWQGLVCDCGEHSCSVQTLYLDRHNLTGHLPDSMENFSKMSQLILRLNNIQGTITPSIGNMTGLEVLDLSYNNFHGEIPPSIGRLFGLRTLNLASNRLEKIPQELYELRSLQALSLFHNQITGLISPGIGNLTSLETLQLQANLFDPQLLPQEICRLRLLRNMDISRIRLLGPLPDCLYGMTSLRSLTCEGNNLSCTLSEAIGNLTNLISLDLAYSKLFGSIPASMGNLSKMIDLTLTGNLLTGSVPRTFANLTKVQVLSLQYNRLDGKIDFLAHLNISLFYLHNNLFTGHFEVPEGGGAGGGGLPRVVYLDVSLNSLSGPIPFNPHWRRIQCYEVYRNYFSSTLPSFVNTSLLFMAAFSNYISSTIPSDLLTDARHLYYLGLSANLLTGTIPVGVTQFPLLNQLLLGQNLLTGTLPNMKNSTFLVVLDVSANRLHGRLADSLKRIKFIEQLFLQVNAFTGPIQDLVNSTLQRELVNIDLSSNDFSGTLPRQLFLDAKKLATFAASSNCLDGGIPEEICQSRSLASLSLDGLTTSENCRDSIFPAVPYLNGFTASHFVKGTIPSCLYAMPSLELLHLSGNGLTGRIPTDVNISSALINLALSHNALTGTIPDAIQLRQWSFLDLSYNKLSGRLSESFETPTSNSSTFLEVNRLSGRIPSSLIHSPSDVSILSGNIFACNVMRSDLPASDPDVNSYSCGSDNANNVLFVWIGTVVCLPLIVFFLMRLFSQTSLSLKAMVREVWKQWSVWTAALREDDNRVNLTRLSIYFSEVRQGTLRLTAYCILVLMPVYSVLKAYRSSYSIEYAWSISAMLMNGEAAAIVLFVALIVLAVLYLIVVKGIVTRLNVRMPKDRSRRSLPEMNATVLLTERILVYGLIICLDLGLMLAVDVSYVFVVISYDTFVTTWAAFALALFRFGTNHLLLQQALPRTFDFLRWMQLKRRCRGAGKTSDKISAPARPEFTATDISFLENLTLFNNIIIPGIAIVCILPDCFYNALFSANDITSYYNYKICYEYAPVQGFSHLCVTGTETDVYSPPFIYSYQCSSKIVINYVPVYVLMSLIVAVIPLMKITGFFVYQTLRDRQDDRSKGLRILLEHFLPEHLRDFRSCLTEGIRVSHSVPSSSSSSSSLSLSGGSDVKRSLFVFTGGEKKKKKRFFSKLLMTVQINSYLTILMCFGALFPPLALIAALSIFSITYFEELCIGRVLAVSRRLGLGYGWYEEQIERECEGVEESSNLTIWSTLVVSCCLYGYMIFDTMGDSLGWEGALPMTLTMMSMPLICYALFRLSRSVVRRGRETGAVEDTSAKTAADLMRDEEEKREVQVEGEGRRAEEPRSKSVIELSSRFTELSVVSNPIRS